MQPRKRPRSRLPRVLLAGVVLVAGAGCGSSFDAQTNMVYQPAAGIIDREGRLSALNVLVVFDRGRGTVIGALLNQAPRGDALVGISGRAENQSVLSTGIEGSELPLPSGRLVQLGDRGAVSVAGRDITLGSVVELTFEFRNAAPITVEVPVVARTGDYATIPVRR